MAGAAVRAGRPLALPHARLGGGHAGLHEVRGLQCRRRPQPGKESGVFWRLWADVSLEAVFDSRCVVTSRQVEQPTVVIWGDGDRVLGVEPAEVSPRP